MLYHTRTADWSCYCQQWNHLWKISFTKFYSKKWL